MFNRNVINGLLIAAFLGLPLSYGTAQVVNPGIQQSGAVTAGHCVKWGPGIGQASDAGADCAAAPPSAANPTATAGPSAVNGVATTYMRSDAAPAVQLGSNAAPGIVQGDGTSISCSGGICSGPQAANPTGIIKSTATNGVATTFMRSDAAPAAQLASNVAAGIMRGDGTTINCVSGACTGASAANPTATAGAAAINGSAATFMRSDAAPAITLGTNVAQGIVRGDGTTFTCTAGVCSAIAGNFPTPTRTGDVIYWNGSAWVALPGNNSGTGILAENSTGSPTWFSPAVLATTVLTTRTTTSTSAVMAGFGSSCSITPTLTGRVSASFTFDTTTTTTGGSNISISFRYGTGTAPAQGATSTGTQVGGSLINAPSTANYNIAMTVPVVITGLSPGTTYWFDTTFNNSVAGTVTLANGFCSAREF